MKTREVRPPNRPRLEQDVLVALQHLRTETNDISRLFIANVERDLVQLIDFVNQEVSDSKQRRQMNVTLASMKEMLTEISTKPEKGRLKDLRRIEDAIRSMMKLVPHPKT